MSRQPCNRRPGGHRCPICSLSELAEAAPDWLLHLSLWTLVAAVGLLLLEVLP